MLQGWLTDYYQQGSEGQVKWAFMGAAHADAKGWDEAGIVLLETESTLTLFNPDKTVLWAGRIEKVVGEAGQVFDRQGELASLSAVFNRPDREPYSVWMPKGIAAQNWLEWCYRKPPLEAVLERP